MPTSLICRKCAAQIAESTIRLPGSNQVSLHTKGLPVERPFSCSILTPRFERGAPKSSRSLHYNAILKNTGSNSSTSPLHFSMAASQEQDNAIESNNDVQPKGPTREVLSQSPSADDGEALKENTDNGPTMSHFNSLTAESPGQDNAMQLTLRKYALPLELTGQALSQTPTAGRVEDLRAKLMASSVNYMLPLVEDLRAIYGLSLPEARVAEYQLRRLPTAGWPLGRYLYWKAVFAHALRRVHGLPYNSPLAAHPGDDVHSVGEIQLIWQRQTPVSRAQHWVYWLEVELRVPAPKILSAFIKATFDPTWCPSYVVEDVLYLLYRRREAASDVELRDWLQREIIEIGIYVLERCPPRYLVLDQDVLRSIAYGLPAPQFTQYYKTLMRLNHPLYPNTLLHFASRFAKTYDTKGYAVAILDDLTAKKLINLNTPSAGSVCTSLLNLKENEPLPDQSVAPDVLFEFLLQRGFQPNLIQLTALMRNFSIRGHIDTAWQIFGRMLQHGLEHDHYVYSILLNGSKRSQHREVTEKILNIIESRSAWTPFLVNDFLDVLYLESETQIGWRRRQRKKVNSSWRLSFRLYVKFYDRAPLRKLGLENPLMPAAPPPAYSTSLTTLAETVRPLPRNRLMQPDSTTLYMMIRAHVRCLLTPKFVAKYYNRLSRLVAKKDPMVLKLFETQGGRLNDVFLRALMQFKVTTGFAISQLEIMMKAAAEEKQKYGFNRYHHPPTVHTWSIVLNGLKNHMDVRGAVALLNMMPGVGGVKPTLPTWNTLIHLFARVRNVEAAVRAVHLLEKAGLEPNERTFKAFNMFPRLLREQAISSLEKMRTKVVKSSDMGTPPLDSGTQSGASETRDTDADRTPVDEPMENQKENQKSAMPTTLAELAQTQTQFDIRWVATHNFRELRDMLARDPDDRDMSIRSNIGRNRQRKTKFFTL